MKIVFAHPLFRPFEPMFREMLGGSHELVFATASECAGPGGAFDDVDVLVSARFPSEWAARFPSLKLLQAAGAGIDKIDTHSLPSGARLCRTAGHGGSIAEYVVMTMIALQRRLPWADRELREGRWRCAQFDPSSKMPPTLAGRAVATLGTGDIGRSVAQACSRFAMRCIGLNRSGHEAGDMFEQCLPISRLDEVLPGTDFVVLAFPLTEDTHELFDARRIGLMRSEAFLINVARAQVVDEQALFEALKHRSIAGAALDVWYSYPTSGTNEGPPARHPFHELDNVILTPHMSGVTLATFEHRARDIAHNVLALQSGAPLRGEVEFRGATSSQSRAT